MAKQAHDFSGHIPLEKGKLKEVRKFINAWLIDQAYYCGNCGFPYFPNEQACCDSPRIGRNLEHLWAVILQNKARRTIRDNQFGANRTKTMRIAISLPPQLLRALERFSLERFGEKLFENPKQFHEFMRAFPQFMVCEKI